MCAASNTAGKMQKNAKTGDPCGYVIVVQESLAPLVLHALIADKGIRTLRHLSPETCYSFLDCHIDGDGNQTTVLAS